MEGNKCYFKERNISLFTDRKKVDTIILFSCNSTAGTDSMVKSLSASWKPSFAFVTPAEHPNWNGLEGFLNLNKLQIIYPHLLLNLSFLQISPKYRTRLELN